MIDAVVGYARRGFSLVAGRHPSSSVSTNTSHLVIIGSGWGAYKVLQNVDQSIYNVTIISPRDYFVFTPLLTGACVGTHEDRVAIESIYQQTRQPGRLEYIQGCVTKIDFAAKTVSAADFPCLSFSSTTTTQPSPTFTVSYDRLVIACGAVVNTFNTPGVSENAFFLKDITDAQAIRSRIISLLTQASHPNISQDTMCQLLHFVVVGGGPTGIEFLGELYDLIHDDVSRLFAKNIVSSIRMSVFDVAPKILASFDPSLTEFIMSRFAEMGISIQTSKIIKHVGSDFLELKDSTKIPYGLLLWATGVAPAPLTTSINKETVAKDPRTGRILTDSYLRVFHGSKEKYFSDVFAIGDCAVISNEDLPFTAQVAKQKGEYLAKLLNCSSSDTLPKPFKFNSNGYLAYIGTRKAVAALKLPFKSKISLIKGFFGNVVWSLAYLSMISSWRNMFLLPMYWTVTRICGRDVSNIKFRR